MEYIACNAVFSQFDLLYKFDANNDKDDGCKLGEILG